MAKNIIICFDGTGNEYSEHNTNVVKLYEAIVRDKSQIAFYDPGVGTFSFLGRSLGRQTGLLLGKAFGAGLCQNIEDGYEYLMNTYEQGDKVFLFGFSRGAFTARALAGMIYRFGLLQKGSKNLIPYVSKMYNNRDFAVSAKFKATFCQECNPHFVGVWDTVASLGYINGKTFYDHKLNPSISFAYQAVSIDEKRKKFPISLWDESTKATGQTIEQVWFAGVHSDVGGSYKECGLSDIPLGWMLDNAQKCGLQLKTNHQNAMTQDSKDTLHNSRTGAWKMWQEAPRQIPKNANIHKSVIERMELVATYKPSNLPSEYEVVSNESYEKRKLE